MAARPLADTTAAVPVQVREAAARRRRWGIVTANVLRSPTCREDTRRAGLRMLSCRVRQLIADAVHDSRTLATFACHQPLCPQCRHQRGRRWQHRVNQWLEENRTTGILLDGRGRRWEATTPEQADNAVRLAHARYPKDDAGFRRAIEQWRRREEQAGSEHFFLLFVTLTIRNRRNLLVRENVPGSEHEGEIIWNALAEDIQRPWRTMRETARRRPTGKAGTLWGAVAGGIKVVEITYNRDKQSWHPHIHALLFCRESFIAKNRLAELWSQYADGYITDVRAVRNEQKAVKELVKYLTKPILSHHKGTDAVDALRRTEGKRLEELNDAIRGRRLISTFGICYGAAPEPQALPSEAVDSCTVTVWHYGVGGEDGWVPKRVHAAVIPLDPAGFALARRLAAQGLDHTLLLAWEGQAIVEWRWQRYYMQWLRDDARDPTREWA